MIETSLELSIIIVNWNACEYLRQCLTSLHATKAGLRIEVIIVDNGSHDGSEKMVRADFPQAHFIQTGRNLGFARANNLGAEQSRGDVLLFLNPDTEVRGSALRELRSYLYSCVGVGAVGARVLNTDGSFQSSCIQGFPNLLNQCLDSEYLRRLLPTAAIWGRQPQADGAQVASAVDAVSGACLMVKKKVFENVGGFNENYFMYTDDLDLCYRIWKSGYSVQYLPWCEIVHHKGQSSSKQAQEFEALHQRESMARFFRSTRGRTYAYAYRAGMGVVACFRTLIVLAFMMCGRRAVQGKAIRSVLRKWFAVVRWSLGRRLDGLQSGTAA